MRSQLSKTRLARRNTWPAFGLAAFLISGCNMYSQPPMLAPTASHSDLQAKELSEVKHALAVTEIKAQPVPTISATGYAVISSQPGKTLNQRRLMAIRAARMDAMRALTEQIHGLTVQGNTQVSESTLKSDTVTTQVNGVIRGARTVKIEPKGKDNYSVVLEIDRATIAQILKSTRRF